MNNGKIVYILGAGCSRADGLPMQADILKQIFELQLTESGQIDLNVDLLDIQQNNAPIEYTTRFQIFDKNRYLLGCFLLENFGTSVQKNKLVDLMYELRTIKNLSEERKHKSEIYEMASTLYIPLEDIFTIFDKVDLQREHWRKYSDSKMLEVYDALKVCIIYAVCFQMEQIENRPVYEQFAKMLINKRIKDGLKKDKLSIITLNWDTMLEQELYRKCKGTEKKVMPDYCFYSYPFTENARWIPSTLLKTKGFYNIKILKLHGSFNWLVCPRCGRISIDFEDNIAKYVLGADRKEQSFCKYCSMEYELENRPKLRSLFVSPTYLKSFHDSNIKNIWHNAFIELSEADKVVFIGYSLPSADFEFKHLLKETLTDQCEIEVVLTQNDNLNFYSKQMNMIDGKVRKNVVNRLDVPSVRYENFFGKDKIKFYYDGVEKYLRGLENGS